MATISLLNRETRHCEKCNRTMNGVRFAGMTEVAGETITIDVAGERFLCDEHFEEFVTAGGHRVISNE